MLWPTVSPSNTQMSGSLFLVIGCRPTHLFVFVGKPEQNRVDICFHSQCRRFKQVIVFSVL